MVRELTRDPRGRPQKSPEKTKARQRGRPAGSVKLLANDRWRYLYALTQTAIENAGVSDGPSEQDICLKFASFKGGRAAKAGEVIIGRTTVASHPDEIWQQGLPVQFVHEQWDGLREHNRNYFRKQQHGPAWRDKSKFRVIADNMRRTLRLWRNAPATNPNRRWLAGMVKAMRICFSGLEEAGGQAESFAVEIGEARYFAAKLRPLLSKYAELRRAGVDDRDLPPLSQMHDLIEPNYLPNDSQ